MGKEVEADTPADSVQISDDTLAEQVARVLSDIANPRIPSTVTPPLAVDVFLRVGYEQNRSEDKPPKPRRLVPDGWDF
jgi:hypothetical protein